MKLLLRSNGDPKWGLEMFLLIPNFCRLAPVSIFFQSFQDFPNILEDLGHYFQIIPIFINKC